MKKLSRKSLVAIALVVAIGASLAIGGTLAYFTDTTDEAQNTFTMGNVDIKLVESSKADAANNIVAGVANGKHGFDYASMKPGFTYSKIPTVSIENPSEDCYVFLKMDLTKYVSLVNLMMLNENATNGDATDYASTTAFVQALAADKTLFQNVVNKWFSGITHTDWQIMNLADLQTAFESWTASDSEPGSNPDHLQLVFGYLGGPLSNESDGVKEATFMNGFTIPDTVTGDMMAPEAYANGNSDISGMKMTFTGYGIQADGLADIDAAYAAMKDTILTPAP